ncbi:MAG: hypothetical protein ACP5RV_12955, partial [Thiomonas sp.]
AFVAGDAAAVDKPPSASNTKKLTLPTHPTDPQADFGRWRAFRAPGDQSGSHDQEAAAGYQQPAA